LTVSIFFEPDQNTSSSAAGATVAAP